MPIYRVYEWPGYYPSESTEPYPTGLLIEADSPDAIPTRVWVDNPEDEWRLHGWEGDKTTMPAFELAYRNTGGLQRGLMQDASLDGWVWDDESSSETGR